MVRSYAFGMPWVPRILLEAIIAWALQATMSRYIPQLLPYVWLAILVALSAEILNAKPVRDRLLGVYSRWGVGDKMMTYVIISLLGAGLLSLYWWSIGKTFAVLEQQK